jgi:hypothetical protein
LPVAFSDGLEEAVDDDPYEIQWQVWRRPVPHGARVVVTVPGVVLRARGRPHRTNSGGDSVTTWPCKFTRKWFEGMASPPSRARRVSRTGVGGAVSRD